MPLPIIPPTPYWASESITDTAVFNGVTVTYPNKVEPPLEIQQNGILAGTPITLGYLNYQFDTINKNISYFKYKVPLIMPLNPGRVISSVDYNPYIRNYTTENRTFTIEYGLSPVDSIVTLRQANTGVITVVAGVNVTLLVKPGFQAKTSGIHTTIVLTKVSDNGTSEVWDVSGEVGV